MAAGFITLSWSPHPAIIAAQFISAADALESHRDPLVRAVEQVVSPAIKQNFDSEGRPAWTPLANTTLARRANPSSPILVQTGLLKQVATSVKPWTINDDTAYLIAGQLGDAYYGAIHNSGSRWMPARPWSVMSSEDERAIEEVFSNWAFNTVAQVGLWGRAVGFITGLFRR